MAERVFPHVVVRKLSPNASARRTAITGIVVHSTEGGNARGYGDLAALGGWFANPAAQVSAHAAVDAEGFSGRFVRDGLKAWHCAALNGSTLGLEHIGRAAQTSWTSAQERESARWLAYWNHRHGVDLHKGRVVAGRVFGVVRHSDLGVAGGGHHDPGKGFDLAHVLELARRYAR